MNDEKLIHWIKLWNNILYQKKKKKNGTRMYSACDYTINNQCYYNLLCNARCASKIGEVNTNLTIET